MNILFSLKTWLLAMLSIFAPIREILIVVGILVIIDMLVGVYRSWKLKVPITSRKLANTVSKMLLYQVTVISAYLLQRYLLEDLIPVANVAATVVGIVEFKSVVESTEAVTGVKIWGKVKNLFNRVGEKDSTRLEDRPLD